jgi:mono/diheme cytochrome c family protein
MLMKAIIAAFAGVLVVSGWAVSAAGIPVAPVAQDAAKIEAGKKVYDAQKCVMCHMIAGKGSKMSPLDGVGTKLKAEDIKLWIVEPATMEAKLATKPKIKMKAYKLAPADLDALVAYMVSLKK